LLAQGLTDVGIALELGIAVATVRTHLVRLYRDNGFANRTEAVVAWLEMPSAHSGSATADRRRTMDRRAGPDFP
ncbi:MAG TPA: LuxR C-terminal-related transcriptional regulator, partial [Candidatus Dormibacteraeota bacterium]|nr:LuxR C-terminal-related transcriptional regulator [Candidatus Dormibacteraeota bacterium]